MRKRLKSFFDRPGVTPGRVAPFVALGLIVPAFLVGEQIKPLNQDQASYESAPTVVANAGSPAPAPAPVAPAATTTPPPSDSSSSSSDTSADTSSSDDGSSADTSSADTSADTSSTDTSTDDTTTDDTTDDTSTDDQTADPSTTDSYTGTVVRVNPSANSYTLATDDQSLIPVHADTLPAPGDVIKAAVSPLSNGTYDQAADPTDEDPPDKISFRGYVTWSAPAAAAPATTPATIVVSNQGASIPIAAAAGSTTPLPALGSAVLVEVTIDKTTGALTAVADPSVEGAPTPDLAMHMETIVQKVDAVNGVTLSADDLRSTDADVVAKPPSPDLDASVLEKDEAIDATVTIAADGTYALTGWSDDSDADVANDPDKAAGDQVLSAPSEKVRPWVDRVLSQYGFVSLTR